MSDPIWPHGLQNTRLSCPSLSPRFTSIEMVMISNHLILYCPLLIFPSILPSLTVFSNEWLFASGSQSIRALASVLPMNIQSWFPLGLTVLISLQSKGTLKSLLQHHCLKASVLQCSTFFMVQLSHPYKTSEKTIALTNGLLLANWCLCFLIHCLGFS